AAAGARRAAAGAGPRLPPTRHGGVDRPGTGLEGPRRRVRGTRLRVRRAPRDASRPRGRPARPAHPSAHGGDDAPTRGADVLTYEKRIEVRWRDVDALRHVNNAVYATYLEECRDDWLAQALGDDGAMWDYVLARVAIDFRREVGLDEEAVLARASLARIGTSSIT